MKYFGFEPQRALDVLKQSLADAPAQLADGVTRVVRDAPPERIDRLMRSPARSVATGAHLTRTGYVVGTLDYVAPEQVQGGSVDGRADTYALACVLYRAVAGHVPVARPGDVAKMWAHLNDPPPSAGAISPAVSAELDGVIRRGMV